MHFQFSTIDKKRAEEFLASESFSRYSEAQKNFVLENLGSIRVLDPMMHGPGMISFSDEAVMVEFLKLGQHDPEEFMFNCQYLNISLPLIEWGLDQGFPPLSWALNEAVERERDDAIKLYLARGLATREDVLSRLCGCKCSSSFFIKVHQELQLGKGASPWGLAEKYSAEELLKMVDLGIVSAESFKYCDREKYNQIRNLKKARKAG